MDSIPETFGARKMMTLSHERVSTNHWALLAQTAYCHLGHAFIRYHDLKHPADIGRAELEMLGQIWPMRAKCRLAHTNRRRLRTKHIDF
jgi:hypothetical protein